MATNPNKANNFVTRRAARNERKEQMAYAQDWGKDRGISRDQNKLIWSNRKQHDDIVKYLAAAAWNDASGANTAADWQGPVSPQHPAPTAVHPYTAGVDPNQATMGPATFSTDPRLRGAGYWSNQTGQFLDRYKNGLDGLDDTEERIMRRRMYDLMAQLRNHPSRATDRWGYNANRQSLGGLNYFMHNTLGDAGIPITN
jgi:hypothetical protein